jgi:hypothetical protein
MALPRSRGEELNKHHRHNGIYAEMQILKQESLIGGIERRKLKWCGHLVRMAEDRKPRQILEARMEGKRRRGRPRKMWMDNIKEAGGKRGKIIQEVGPWQ